MNLAQTFFPARLMAQHCAELTERGPRPEERAESLASWRRDIAREVAQDMTELLSGAKLEAKISDPEIVRGSVVFDRVGAVAANSLLRCGGDDQTALLSFSVATAIALTDRSFGGSGEEPSEPVTVLPRSAALLIEQVARTIASAIARVSAGGGAAGAMEGDVIIRSENASRLKPFTPSAECALFTATLSAPDGIVWEGHLAITRDRLDSLLPGLASAASAKEDDELDPAAQREADDAVFGPVPLPLQAVLAEFDLSLGQLDRLAPGDEIPIAIAREIPLRLGAQLVAAGSLGTMEDRMALKVISLPIAALPTQSAQEVGGVNPALTPIEGQPV